MTNKVFEVRRHSNTGEEIVKYYTEEELEKIRDMAREDERKEKEILGELYDVLYQYKDLLSEDIYSIIEYFVLMEQGKKPATELEIRIHCTTPRGTKRAKITFCHTVGCENCGYAIPEVLSQIIQLKKEIERFGYFAELSKNYHMYVSKNKELTDILARKMSEPVPVYYHTVIRGLAFGHSEEEIAKYMKARLGEIEIDWETAGRVREIVSEMIHNNTSEDRMSLEDIKNELEQFSISELDELESKIGQL